MDEEFKPNKDHLMALKMLDCDCEACQYARERMFAQFTQHSIECLDENHPGWQKEFRVYQAPFKVSEVERLVMFHLSKHAAESAEGQEAFDAALKDPIKFRLTVMSEAQNIARQAELAGALDQLKDMLGGGGNGPRGPMGFKPNGDGEGHC